MAETTLIMVCRELQKVVFFCCLLAVYFLPLDILLFIFFKLCFRLCYAIVFYAFISGFDVSVFMVVALYLIYLLF